VPIDNITFGGLSVPLTNDVKSQAPEAFCELNPTNVSRNLVINRDVAPFDKPELRRAMALSLDRQGFLDIITHPSGISGFCQKTVPLSLMRKQVRLAGVLRWGYLVKNRRMRPSNGHLPLGYLTSGEWQNVLGGGLAQVLGSHRRRATATSGSTCQRRRENASAGRGKNASRTDARWWSLDGWDLMGR
jgi:hypothetical protein